MPRPVAAMPRGMTLIELLVVIAIVAVLAGLALPGYGAYVARAHRAQAQAQLMQAAQFLERFYAAHATYTGAVLPPGLSVSPPGADTATAHYTLAVTGSDTGYTLTATRQGAPDGCGNLRLQHTGAREVTHPNARVEDCWR